VFVQRIGDNSRESKINTFKVIAQRQQEVYEGKAKVPFLIFPEGSTSNGDYLISFKKGAFASLLPVQPLTSVSQSQMISINPLAAHFITACGHQFKTLRQKQYPVFAPNEYFWKNHMKQGEEKVDTYMRIVHQIMMDGGGFKDGS